MKFRILLFFALIIFGFSAFSQNKSLGVGTSTPNPNAALHVESPTNNQGIIIPRLTEAERLGMTLTAAEKGLIVFDNTINSVFTWDGSQWSETGRLSYPYVDTILSAPNNSNLLRLVYAGSLTENVGVAHFENLNPNSGFSAIFGRTNSATNGAMDLTVNNASNNNDAIGVNTNGLGTAGRFIVNNALNTSAAIYATTNGNGSPTTSAAILGETSTAFSAVTGVVTGPAGSNAIFGTSSSSNAFSYAVLGSTTGGGVSGKFDINNAANTSNALEASTNGTGSAGKFTINRATSTEAAIVGESNGVALGAGVFGNNTGNGFGVVGKSMGTVFGSAAVYGEHTGTGDAAGAFRISNAANTFSGLYGETNGSGSAIRGLNIGTGNGAYFRKNGATSGSAAMWADNFGNDGYGAIIQNISATNPKAALFVESVGTGPSAWINKDPTETGNTIEATHAGTAGSPGLFIISNASNNSPVVDVQTNSNGFGIKSVTTGTEVAGYFQTNNGAANSSTVFSLTNSANGHAIGASNVAEGSALSIFQGGMKVSTATLSAGTTITTRAVAYQITGGGPYTFSFALSDGELFYFFNTTGGSVTVAGTAIPAGTGKTFVVLGGVARAL
jgi:hypothetical protein